MEVIQQVAGSERLLPLDIGSDPVKQGNFLVKSAQMPDFRCSGLRN
jgi:hypothetical protein